MKTYRAKPIARLLGFHESPPPIEVIEFSLDLPEIDNLGRWAEIAETAAASIERVLWLNLPGGVYDRLFGEMCRRKASLFAVSHGEREK